MHRRRLDGSLQGDGAALPGHRGQREGTGRGRRQPRLHQPVGRVGGGAARRRAPGPEGYPGGGSDARAPGRPGTAQDAYPAYAGVPHGRGAGAPLGNRSLLPLPTDPHPVADGHGARRRGREGPHAGHQRHSLDRQGLARGIQAVPGGGRQDLRIRGPMIHAKTLVADGWWSKVGSTNLNFSSLIANWEIDLVVEDTDFADQMERLFEDDISNSREVSLEGSGQRRRVRPDGRVDTSDSGARAGVVGSGTGSGATISRVVPTLVQKGAAPLQTHEHALAAAGSGALLGVSLLGARFPRLVAWPLVAVGAFLGGLGVLRAAQSTLSDSEEDRPESGAT